VAVRKLHNFSFQILDILLHFNLKGFSSQISFSKRAVQMSVKYVGLLKIAALQWEFMNPLHNPGIIKVKQKSERNSEKEFKESETFSGSKFDPATGIIGSRF